MIVEHADPIECFHESHQGRLFVVFESDDAHLIRTGSVPWFNILRNLDWRPFRPIAAKYYDALYLFNVAQAEKRAIVLPPNPETAEEADGRLVFERATMDEELDVLHRIPAFEADLDKLGEPADVNRMAPGFVPCRGPGRQPKCFFAMLYAFLGVSVSGQAAEPENVHQKLVENAAFARVCGFTLPDASGYRQSDVPSLRKLEQFDQIMTENGLWGEAKALLVRENILNGVVKIEKTIVHDTTHHEAFSGMRVLNVAEETNADDESPATETSDGGEPNDAPMAATVGGGLAGSSSSPATRKKSHPRTTKNCRCPDKTRCGHPWVSADEGAGTVVKHGGKMFWAHKASTISFAEQEVLLDAVAVSDAASHDSQTVPDHLHRLFELYPELDGEIDRMLDDAAADDRALKDLVWNEWGIELMTPINPRNRKPIVDDLPKGIDHITARGVPVCMAGFPMDFVGCRHGDKRFLFRAPDDASGTPVCQNCTFREECYRGGAGARQTAIPFERLHWIDPHNPQLSISFQKAMTRRTVIERLHKLMKFDFGDPDLTKRGNGSYQALLDKTVLAMHLTIANG